MFLQQYNVTSRLRVMMMMVMVMMIVMITTMSDEDDDDDDDVLIQLTHNFPEAYPVFAQINTRTPTYPEHVYNTSAAILRVRRVVRDC